MSARAPLPWITLHYVALILLSVLVLSYGDPHPVENEDGCTCEPGARPFESYHIHVLFYPDLDGTGEFCNNTRSSKYARALRKTFIDHFDVPDCDEANIFNLTKLCAFAVDDTGAGGLRNSAPFVAPNFAIYVPVDRYMDAVPWMMANRGDLDFLVHPNSCGHTCSPQDHLLWSTWAGDKWPVRFELSSSENSPTSHPELPTKTPSTDNVNVFDYLIHSKHRVIWISISALSVILFGGAAVFCFRKNCASSTRKVLDQMEVELNSSRQEDGSETQDIAEPAVL